MWTADLVAIFLPLELKHGGTLRKSEPGNLLPFRIQ